MAGTSKSYRIEEAGDLGVPVEEVCAFYRDHSEREIALGLPSFYRWQFCDPPENDGQDASCIVVRDDDEVLGVMGVNRRTFWLGGKPRKAAELTTLVVSERFQGRGLGFRIVGFLQETYDVVLGFGLTYQAAMIYMTTGHQYVRCVPRFVRVFDMEAIAEYAQIEKLGKRLIARWKNVEKIAYTVRSVEAAELAACVRFLEESFNHFTRDANSLTWRYNRHPFFAYEAYLVESRGAEAAVIVRVDDVAGMRIVHVIDCFGSDVALPGAVSFIDDFCREKSASVADFTCTAPVISRHFRAAGWFSILDDSWFQFINLFYPPESRTPPTTSMAFWARNDMIDLMDTARLYVTKGDVDMDRPTIAHYRSAGVVDELNELGFRNGVESDVG